GVVFSKDGRTLYTGSGTRESRGEVRAWDVEDGGWSVAEAHEGEIFSAAWARDGKVLATGCASGVIKLWDAGTGRPTATLTGHKGRVGALAFSPDGQTLASLSGDRSVKLWDVAGRKERVELGRHQREPIGVAFSPDGKLVATSSAVANNSEGG